MKIGILLTGTLPEDVVAAGGEYDWHFRQLLGPLAADFEFETFDIVGGAPLPAPTPAPETAIAGDGTISDNSFSTVTARESIESDAARLARLQQGTVVLEAEPVPERTDGVNLAAFARGTTHRVGQRIYRRSGGRNGSAARICRRYGNPDEAQRDFLAKGGPERDSMGIDPDGDGFVCGWTPDVLRSLRVGG